MIRPYSNYSNNSTFRDKMHTYLLILLMPLQLVKMHMDNMKWIPMGDIDYMWQKNISYRYLSVAQERSRYVAMFH